MSLSLEERRAERRRQRQMKEDETNGAQSPDDLHADVQERLARRRKERLERIAALAAGGITVNGEDDLERRRRERREARLRASEDTTEDYSSRRSRRRGTDEDITNTEDDYSSYRSRRRRNWDDDETPAVNDTPSVPDTSEEDAAAERRRRQREEEEEEARRQQEREEEEQRRQDEQRRQREAEEEERRRREEARREEEERQRRGKYDNQHHDVYIEPSQSSEYEQNTEDETEDPDLEADDNNKLFIDEDKLLNKEVKQKDKLDRVKQWNEQNNVQNNVPSVGFKSANKYGDSFRAERVEKVTSVKSYNDAKVKDNSLKRSPSIKDSEINNNKIRDKLDKFEHLQEGESNKSVKNKQILPAAVDKKDGLKGRLQKFEKEIKDQEAATKDKSASLPHNTKKEPAAISTPSQKMSAKLQHFEGAMKTQTNTTTSTRNVQGRENRILFGKMSAKLQHFEGAMKTQTNTTTSTRNVQTELEKIGSSKDKRQELLGRWSQSETHINKTESSSTPKKTILDRWNPSQDSTKSETKPLQSRPDVISKSLSGNTGLIASRYLEKASKSIEEPISPQYNRSEERSPVSKSKSFSTKSPLEKKRISEMFENQSQATNNANQSKSHVADRYRPNDRGMSAESRGIVHSRGSSYDDSFNHSRGTSFDASSERSDRYSDRYSQFDQEEEERLEQERLEQERLEEESRMAEEQKKKRGKRKGLGGLTPEKKKLLKQIIMQKAAEDLKKEALAKAEEKEKYINSRVEPILTEGLGEAELRKLCKKLHETLAQIHSDVYDWEFKVGKQEQEITELTNKVNDSKGKFVKPVLRKVNKTEQNLLI